MTDQYSFRGDVATRLKNVICPYCGSELKSENCNIEHVIGRRFVPKNSLDKSWNLILNSCVTCNTKKSDFENDISAITMQPDAAGKFADNSSLLLKEAERRASGAISRKTNRPVGESNEFIDIKSKLGSTSISFNFTSPPQLDQQRIFDLARMQLQGFFYLLTYNPDTGRGYWWTGGFHPLEHSIRSDWGNTTQLAFSQMISDWDVRLLASPADEFFRVCIRKNPQVECWGWALEWNRNYRLIGFFGDERYAQQIVDKFPPERRSLVPGSKGNDLMYKIDKAINPEEDTLFEIPQVDGKTRLPPLKFLKNQ